MVPLDVVELRVGSLARNAIGYRDRRGAIKTAAGRSAVEPRKTEGAPRADPRREARVSSSHADEQTGAVDSEIDFATAAVPDLHVRLARIRDSAAVAPVRFHGQRSWLVTTHAHVLEAFQNEDRFCSAAMHQP
ncbi:MAG: hypothetical protein CL908_25720, partial [Deltaproteobacteria bacterium]|nr:hypothetical protein [Deltaproteobacteria bacterium]